MSACKDFRRRTLALLTGASADIDSARAEHALECDACRLWAVGARARADAVRGLTRVAAPDELEWRLAVSLAAGGSLGRLERALRDLGRATAPPELDARVAAALDPAALDPAALDPRVLAERTPEERTPEESPVARALRRLPRFAAPGVLERLVAEEIASPAAARARRFAGDLERNAAPATLWARVRGEVSRRRLSGSHAPTRPLRGVPRAFAPLVALAAAALLVVWSGFTGGEPRLEPRFEVRRADSAAELSPFAASLADGMSGGFLSAQEGGR